MPIAIIVTLRIYSGGLPKVCILAVFIAFLLGFGHIFRNYLSSRFRKLLFITSAFLIAIIQLFNQGLYSLFPLLVLFITLLTLLYFSSKMQVCLLAIIILLLIGASQAHLYGFYAAPEQLTSAASVYPRLVSTSLLLLVIFAMHAFIAAVEARDTEINELNRELRLRAEKMERINAELTLLRSIFSLCSGCGKAQIESGATGAEEWGSIESYLRQYSRQDKSRVLPRLL